jgi:hypothetical protein
MSQDKETNQLTRTTKRADILALRKLGADLPKWLTKAVTPTEFRDSADDLYDRMGKAKKGKTELFTHNYPVARTSWRWQESKNFTRDVPVIVYSGYLEYFAIKHYRKQLLVKSDAGAWLRGELNDELAKHGRSTSNIAKDQDGLIQSVIVNEWSYPDGIATRNVDAKSVLASIVVTDVLATKARSSVIEDTKESIQKVIQRLESMAIARVNPSKGSAINDGVSQAVTKLVEVSHSAFGNLTLIDLPGALC